MLWNGRLIFSIGRPRTPLGSQWMRFEIPPLKVPGKFTKAVVQVLKRGRQVFDFC